MHSAAGGISQRLKLALAVVLSRSRSPAPGAASPPAWSIVAMAFPLSGSVSPSQRPFGCVSFAFSPYSVCLQHLLVSADFSAPAILPRYLQLGTVSFVQLEVSLLIS